MRRRHPWPRKALDASVKVASGIASLLGIFFLGWILYVVALRGAAAIDWEFLTSLPAPPMVEGGGLGNAIAGTALMTSIAALAGIPAGLLGGVFLAEHGARFGIADAVRFTANVLMGMPSIIIGLFVYTAIVVPAGRFSGWAGAVSLAFIMLPVVMRTTEDMLGMVPNELREAALSLGAPRWKVTVGVVFRAARAGLVTGVLLAIARVSGETAPLLFTALNSPYAVESLGRPTANLTVTIFSYAMSPYERWQAMAWGGSLLITAAVLALTVLGRVAFGAKR